MTETTPADLIDAKGAHHIAEVLTVPIGTVRMWRHRNAIPRAVWPEMIAAFDDLSLGRLKALEAAGGREHA